jgi:hypothetical protein
MRPSGPIIFGFTLAIGITLTLPHFAFGAARSFGGSGRFKAAKIDRQHSFLRPFHGFDSSGRFRAPKVHRQDFFSHPFHGFGFVGVGGVSEQPVIIIQQFQPAPITEPREPATNRVYVQPRWVDGGHGVEVLQPGYWTDAKRAAER